MYEKYFLWWIIIKTKFKAIIAYSVLPTVIICLNSFGILYTTIISLLFLILLGELGITAWLMIRLAYKEKQKSSSENLKTQNEINFKQAKEFYLANNDITCN